MNEIKEFVEWIALAAGFVGAMTPFIMAVVHGLGKFVSGKAQTAAAIVVGLVFGALGFLGLWGVPASFYDAFKMLLFLAATVGTPIGTYEAIKHASGG
jgi:hypothetical protein